MTRSPAAALDDRSPFAFPVFREVWSANLLSNLGALVLVVGASWMMTESGASPQMVALVQGASSLPIVVLSLLAGALADNRDRRTVMISAQVFRIVASVMLAVLAYTGVVTPWLLLAFTFLVGCGVAMNGPAWQASVGDMVPRSILPVAVTFNSMAMNIARTVGPALGGVIVTMAGGPATFLVNAAGSVPLIVALARWRQEPRPRALPPERLPVAMIDGVRFAAMSPPIRTVMVRALLFAIPASAVQALMPLVARDLLRGGPFTFGLLLGAFGAGAIGGAFVVRRLRRSLLPEQVVQMSTILVAICLGVAGSSRALPLTLPVLVLAGVGWVLAFSTINVSVQLAAPQWVLARALALYHTATFAGVAAGSWAIGLCADRVGTGTALLVAVAFALLTLSLSLVQPLAAFGSDDLDPLDAQEQLSIVTPPNEGSGPVVIAIEHRIASGDAAQFLDVMRERRRIRLRDGARHWTLLRDIGDPDLWVERYDVPTWLDYLRHLGRRTRADAANAEALRALSLAEGEVVVHRMVEVRHMGGFRRMEVVPSLSSEGI